MAKVALLIGISEYGEGLSALPGTQEDISILQRVLQSPQIGGFDQVDLLPNPDRTQMESAIETLFTENRDRNDLVLLYFSGHGVRDDNGTLYFANRITEKNAQGRIRISTAVPASALQHYMSRSRSKRLVLILDCCFSGAFANDMRAKHADEAVDVKAQLGGEGRAVLTSSTATQVSYEKEGASIYTRYLVQGLETGAADRNEDGQITVDELHEYAREKVQEAAPTMQPEIYAVREGYKILLARAPQGDPKLIFRKEFDERAKQKRGKLSPVDQRALRYRGQELGLSSQEAEQIASEILQPYEIFWTKVSEFEQAIQEALAFDPYLSASSLEDLRYFQKRILKLRDEDILPVLKTYNLNLNPPPNPNPVRAGLADSPPATPQPPTKPYFQSVFNLRDEDIRPIFNTYQLNLNPPPNPNPVRAGLADSPPATPQPPTKPAPTNPQNLGKGRVAGEKYGLDLGAIARKAQPQVEDDLSSEKGIDYTKLRNLLKAQKWKEADMETADLMLEAIRKKSWFQVESEDLLNFPCADLKTIDALWVKYSKGHFGFSIQKQIYVECGAKLDGKYPGDEIWEKFGDRVGWRKDGNWVYYSDLNPSLSSPKGIFPLVVNFFYDFWFIGGWVTLFSRTETCKV